MVPLILLYWTFSEISSGFQSQIAQPYSHLVEVYLLHVPRDSPLVWHLPTSLSYVLLWNVKMHNGCKVYRSQHSNFLIFSIAVCSLSGKYIRVKSRQILSWMTCRQCADNMQMTCGWLKNMKSHETWPRMASADPGKMTCHPHVIYTSSVYPGGWHCLHPPADDIWWTTSSTQHTALHKAYWLPCYKLFLFSLL